jgi:hypothetical protein
MKVAQHVSAGIWQKISQFSVRATSSIGFGKGTASQPAEKLGIWAEDWQFSVRATSSIEFGKGTASAVPPAMPRLKGL